MLVLITVIAEKYAAKPNAFNFTNPIFMAVYFNYQKCAYDDTEKRY